MCTDEPHFSAKYALHAGRLCHRAQFRHEVYFPGAMDNKKTIVIAEDHTIVREGLRALLDSHPEFKVIGEAEDGRRAIQCVGELRPDLILLDLTMPRTSGLAAIREIKRQFPQTRVLVLTVHKTEEYVQATLEAGADGYVSKDDTHTELVVAVRNVLAGKSYLSPGISDRVIRGYLAGKKSAGPATLFDTLTQREREVLKLIGEGYTNKAIGDYLCISAKTVDKHRTNLMRKLDRHTTASLTAYALGKGLIAG